MNDQKPAFPLSMPMMICRANLHPENMMSVELMVSAEMESFAASSKIAVARKVIESLNAEIEKWENTPIETVQ